MYSTGIHVVLQWLYDHYSNYWYTVKDSCALCCSKNVKWMHRVAINAYDTPASFYHMAEKGHSPLFNYQFPLEEHSMP